MLSYKVMKWTVALVTAIAVNGAPLRAENVPEFDPEGPFRQGEGFGTPATCDTLGDWIDRVPDYDGRISMTIRGVLRDSEWDGVLAYLLMCGEEQVQVLCVTYYPAELTGETVLLAGGYMRVGERQVMLDPCLAYPDE
ncbi:hypothetical protein [Oceaniglobus roseus]|uniref:hypothetical protein n=1 Tax=Oceaniglobus roseus TaxID=1737570 RepID=UPI000C7ECE9E|nr:hypothetical protein [Kandeliimicrobium roseum]